MKNPARFTILCLCLAGALPATAAGAVTIAPPDERGGGVGSAGSNSGCDSINVIAFSELPVPGDYAVRHRGDIACEAPLRRAECVARLFQTFDSSPPLLINEEQAEGRRQCEYDSGFTGGFSAGTDFSERYTFKLTLKQGFVWGTPSGDFCTRRNERRQLVCSDSHETEAPAREVDRHTS